MKLLPLCMLALPLSWVVWYLNFSGNNDDFDALAPSLRNRVNLPAPGKLHVIVTGGAGYVGYHTCLRLLEEGHSVTALDNLSHGRYHAILLLKHQLSLRFSFHKVDLGDKAAIHETLSMLKPNVDLVMHIAGVNNPAESRTLPLLYYQNNTGNTIHLLDVMLSLGVTKMVYSSSSDVYGRPVSLPVDETAPTHPVTPLGESRLAAERAVQALGRAEASFQAVILRRFLVYGEGQLGWRGKQSFRQMSGLAACLNKSEGGAVIEVPAASGSSSEWSRDWVHVVDVANAHVAAMRHLSNQVEVYNVASGLPITSTQLAEACHKATGIPVQVVESKVAREGDEPRALYADITKIGSVMGWRPNHTDFQAGVIQTLLPHS